MLVAKYRSSLPCHLALRVGLPVREDPTARNPGGLRCDFGTPYHVHVVVVLYAHVYITTCVRGGHAAEFDHHHCQHYHDGVYGSSTSANVAAVAVAPSMS